MLLILGVGFLVVSFAVYAAFLYVTGKHYNAQDVSDQQDIEWRQKHRN